MKRVADAEVGSVRAHKVQGKYSGGPLVQHPHFACRAVNQGTILLQSIKSGPKATYERALASACSFFFPIKCTVNCDLSD